VRTKLPRDHLCLQPHFRKDLSVDKGQEFVRTFRLTSSESQVLARPTADEGDGNVPPGSARHRNRGRCKMAPLSAKASNANRQSSMDAWCDLTHATRKRDPSAAAFRLIGHEDEWSVRSRCKFNVYVAIRCNVNHSNSIERRCIGRALGQSG
jgi:hypothetical protein